MVLTIMIGDLAWAGPGGGPVGPGGGPNGPGGGPIGPGGGPPGPGGGPAGVEEKVVETWDGEELTET